MLRPLLRNSVSKALFSNVIPNANFQPDHIPGIVNWLAARMLLGRNTSLPATDSAVNNWNDLVNNSFSVTQGTGTFQPLFKTNRINGQPTLLFDGVDDHMIVTSYSVMNVNNSTIFLVGKITGTTGSPQRFYSIGSSSALKINNGVTSSTSNAAYTNDNTGANALLQSHTLNTNLLMYSYRSGNSLGFKLNNATLATQSNSNAPNSGIDRLVLGSTQAVNGSYLKGEIAELIIYNRKLSDIEIAQVVSYLNNIYRIL